MNDFGADSLEHRSGSTVNDAMVHKPVPPDVSKDLDRLDDVSLEEIDEACLGWTMFDSSGSKDGTVSLLLPRERLNDIPAQSLVTIESPDKRVYLAACVEGPFSEPDGLKAEMPVIVTATVRGRGLALFPKFHGRAVLEVMGEYRDGNVAAASYRPLPNSRVYPLPKADAIRLLGTEGNLPIGHSFVGQHDLTLHARTDVKSAFPRHTGILGTTGGGKSTTVSGLVVRAQEAGVPTILFDVEGEYAAMYEPTDEPHMIGALNALGLKPRGARNVTIYTLVGRETRCPDASLVKYFGLNFSELSPYTITEILELNEAQSQRFWTAYELTKRALREVRIYPTSPDEIGESLLLDELEQGWPKMRLGHVYDLIRMVASKVSRNAEPDHFFGFKEADRSKLQQIVQGTDGLTSAPSWWGLQGRINGLIRLKIFDQTGTATLDYDAMLAKRDISVIDLSDTESPQVRNLAIAQILRRLQEAQDRRYALEQQDPKLSHRPTLVIIEEAHEFLSAQRIKDMPILFGQVARIAKRGRKRWLSLVFVTQLPQHLPDEVLSLINNWIVHKVTDSGVLSRLRKSIGAIEANLWDRIPTLGAGQAVVSLQTQKRALITRILPTSCKLLMAD
jgi:hypothetical protein